MGSMKSGIVIPKKNTNELALSTGGRFKLDRHDRTPPRDSDAG